ncbi:hypothetical protein QLF84_23675, partial [Salmonella enterica subsp. enterica serovar Oslo]|nr:hypothetical protein [Salmonella enterica subsp. enterica serovar Oslo]
QPEDGIRDRSVSRGLGDVYKRQLLLNVQINSYDAKGNLVDALLLSSFFAYEDIVRFSDFVICQDYTISIDSYVIYRWYEN